MTHEAKGLRAVLCRFAVGYLIRADSCAPAPASRSTATITGGRATKHNKTKKEISWGFVPVHLI